MRPPICAICGKRGSGLDDEIKLVSFAMRKGDKKFAKKLEDPGFVGHPPWKEWFCEKHYEEAQKLSDLTIDKAMKELHEIFNI
ncbi:MAG: hypothetical protein BAJALOKI3v1_1120009 [Promethearchaeota archaeon]|nr:MAG: hypothetical protein BAJALOKI3v1_1120009 [Candidatus Lokiarchaeota archaeon]